ncbi:MAG: class I SAM-dependent methyltransferase [Chloroflexota bacterium]|nr:class I SAM-dependent methyltransferase [Chloroflexota bacterium]
MSRIRDFPEGQDETLRRMAGADHYNGWLIDRSRPHLGARVLDLGAGVGTFTAMIADQAEWVVALEPDPTFRPALERRFAGASNVEVLALDAEALFAGKTHGPFDSVVCFNVLEHIPDDQGTLEIVRDVLEPGGALLLLVPAHPLLYGGIDRTVAHVRRYSRGPLRILLRRSGFTVETLRHVNPVGAAGWLVTSRLLGRTQIPAGPLTLYDRLVPVLRRLDKVDLHVGLSLWAVARRA